LEQSAGTVTLGTTGISQSNCIVAGNGIFAGGYITIRNYDGFAFTGSLIVTGSTNVLLTVDATMPGRNSFLYSASGMLIGSASTPATDTTTLTISCTNGMPAPNSQYVLVASPAGVIGTRWHTIYKIGYMAWLYNQTSTGDFVQA
jgi:hypothetical protein